MNFGEMKSEVARSLGNLQTSSIFYQNLDEWVNRALQRVPQLVMQSNKGTLNLFPELTTTWQNVTVAGTGYFVIPTDALSTQRLHVFKKVAADRTVDKTYPVQRIEYNRFLQLKKDATVTGYPTLWAPRGKRIYLYPTPSAAYLTDWLLEGIMRELTLAANADEPTINEQWHEIVVAYATYLGARARGWTDEAAFYKNEAMAAIADATDITGLNDMGRSLALEVEGAPTRSSTYGA